MPRPFRLFLLESWDKMIRLKQDNLPKLLRQAFHEEAQNIKYPSRQQFWLKLQQRPEFAAIEKDAEQQLLPPEASTHTRNRLFYFYKKHSSLAGLIAACLLIAVLLSRIIPLMSQADILPQDQISTLETGLQYYYLTENGYCDDVVLFSRELGESEIAGIAEESADLEKAGGATALKSFAPPGSKEDTFTAQGEADFTQGEEKARPPKSLGLQAAENSSSEKQPRNSQLDRSLRPDPEEKTFMDEDSFRQALKEIRPLTTGKIWQLRLLPGGFSFKEGTIICTGEALLQISQVFDSEKNGGFTLTQQFKQEEAMPGAGADPADAPGPSQPMQVGPYHGYFFRPSPGLCTLTWLQEDSLITLSGQFTEEMLRLILAALENPPGE